MDQGGKDSDDGAALAAALGRDAPIDDAEFQRRLLADYDGVMRLRRIRPLAALADAFGWRALARPFAPAALGAATVLLGVVAGALTAPVAVNGEDEAYIYLTAALDSAGGFSAEVAAWAEQ